jgi:divalent metal cation (Fe/Co/Zn/Cd) transporter
MNQPFLAARSKIRNATKQSSTTAVWAALTGDILVALGKARAAFWTGSASMMSEAIHSVVDTTNELLLLYGIRRSKHMRLNARREPGNE